MRKAFLVVLIGLFSVLAAAQTSTCLPPGATLTDDVYWAHQPLAVQALRGFAATDPRLVATAIELAQDGYLIDNAIMVWQWDPACTMAIRLTNGYTWVPSLLMPPILVAPGTSYVGYPSYDSAHPPFGSILVSVNAADYPPAAVPAPQPPALALVGACYDGGPIIGTVCAPGAGLTAPLNGEVVSWGTQDYQVHVTIFLTPIQSAITF